jgi:hypothetical protein
VIIAAVQATGTTLQATYQNVANVLNP